jgi:hypothetical protein
VGGVRTKTSTPLILRLLVASCSILKQVIWENTYSSFSDIFCFIVENFGVFLIMRCGF